MYDGQDVHPGGGLVLSAWSPVFEFQTDHDPKGVRPAVHVQAAQRSCDSMQMRGIIFASGGEVCDRLEEQSGCRISIYEVRKLHCRLV